MVNDKLRCKTPYDYGCVGDGNTDDSIGFRRMLVEDTHLPIKLPAGTFRIDSPVKIPLTNMEGVGSTKSIIKFTHKDGGFIKYKDDNATTYGGFGHFKNFSINGSGTTDYLITCGFSSEGVCNDVRFESPAKSIFKIDYTLELVFFNNCTFTNSTNIFDVSPTAELYNSLNGVFINGGILWMISDSIVNTTLGGGVYIHDAWLEKVARILKKDGIYSFFMHTKGNKIVKSQYTTPLFSISCKGNDTIIFEDNVPFFSSVATPSIFDITRSGNDVCDLKVIKIKDNEINGNESSLLNIITVDPLLKNLFNIRAKIYTNNVSLAFSWWNQIKDKIAVGVSVSGIDDVKNTSTQMIGPIRFSATESESIFGYDSTIKQHYASDANGIKNHILKAKTVTTVLRPTGAQVQAGYMTYDATINKPIWFDGAVWNDKMTKFVSVPATATSPGNVGDWSADASYLYICHSTNTWKRVAVATW